MQRLLGWCTQILCGQVNIQQVRAYGFSNAENHFSSLQHTGEPYEYSVINLTSPIQGPALFPLHIMVHEAKTNATSNSQTCAACIGNAHATAA